MPLCAEVHMRVHQVAWKTENLSQVLQAREQPGHDQDRLAGFAGICRDGLGQRHQQQRICFTWTDAGPEDVQVVDTTKEESVAADTFMLPARE